VSVEPTFAWEPITPRGVAIFARASFARLLLVQSVVAVLAAISVVWFLADGIFPIVDAAIDGLPDNGEIRAGKLDWSAETPVLLADGDFVAFIVDLEHSGQIRSPADFQFEFGAQSLRILSLTGEMQINYPANWIFPANRPQLRPAWGAWSPNFLALAALGTFFGLLLIWALLATIYFFPVWLICFFANRDLNFRQSWRLAGAALMPGALLLALALALYDFGEFDLVQFSFACGMHFIIGWIYVFVSPLFLPRALPAQKSNPFTPPR
jgi:hypothetical protein